MRLLRLPRQVIGKIVMSILALAVVGLTVAYLVGADRLQDRARQTAELTGKILDQVPEFTVKECISAAFGDSQKTIPVMRTDITEAAIMASKIFHYERQDLRTRLASDVAQVLVAPGDVVQAGQALCILNNESAEALLTQAQLDFDLQQARLLDLEDPASAATSPQDLETLRLRVRQAEIALELRELEASRLSIIAPSAGKIVSLKVSTNDYVTAGQSVATIFDDRKMIVLASVSQPDIPSIALDMDATVTFGTEMPVAAGKVISIGLEGAVSGKGVVVPVSIEIDNPYGVYKSGMAANVSIDVDDETTVFAVATCTPGSRVEVKSMVSGSVTDLSARIGDKVTAGQPLLTLANRNTELSVEQSQNDLAIARASLAKIESSQPVKEADLLAQQLRVEQARWTLHQRELDLASLTLVAPFDGTVTRVPVRPGDRLAAGAPVLTVQNPSKMVVTVSVPESLVAKVYKGQQADVVFGNLTDVPYVGTVISVDSEGQLKENGVTFDATVEIAKPVALMPGMLAKVTINTEIRESVLAIPLRLVRQAGLEKVVTAMRVVDEDAAWPRFEPATVVIQTGISDGTLVEVTCGLDEGELLLIPETK